MVSGVEINNVPMLWSIDDSSLIIFYYVVAYVSLKRVALNVEWFYHATHTGLTHGKGFSHPNIY